MERSRQLHLRRGVKIEQPFPVDDGALCADEIWYFGDSATSDTYRAVTRVPLHPLPNTVVKGVRSTLQGKNYSEAKHHFMWMASHGALLRGLDVLLEVFETMPECHLWICGHVEQEKSFFTFYRSHLTATSNIHYVGWIDVAGEQYRDITRRCGYMVYPSVSDGMPGSVVNAMAAGVVPIVTDEAGIDCAGFGLRIASVEHGVIRDLIERAAAVTPVALETQATGTSSYAMKRYSEDAFRTTLRERVEAVACRVFSNTAET
ncbi:MAG: glycosyltransferase family 4 protein [Planctomycetes bacterium]|nr:glycosyltransferase family 4 protein [Planctomycetota bacterium]